MRTLSVLCALLACAAAPSLADTPSHRFIAQDRGMVRILSKDGNVEWEAPCPFVSHDIAVLPNKNVLLHTGPATIVEMNPAKEIVWQYTSKPKEGYTGAVEIHAFQRLKGGLTMVAESGNRRIVEVDREGKITHEVPLTVERPSSHRDTRRVRKLENGNYLVCHEGDGKVREYDRSGTVVWTYALDLAGQPRTPGHDGHGMEVFNALRLKNGNTLIGGGNNNRVFEVTPDGKTVWSVERDELPGVHFCWITGLEVLPNGHIVIGNTHAGPNNPQIIEISRDKKVVWSFKNFDLFGNDLVVFQLLDVKGNVLR